MVLCQPGGPLNLKEVAHVASLAKLGASQEELQKHAEELSKILKYFDQISEVDTKNIEPLVTPSDIELFLREDEAKQECSTEEILSNAPERTGNLFTVPPVI